MIVLALSIAAWSELPKINNTKFLNKQINNQVIVNPLLSGKLIEKMFFSFSYITVNTCDMKRDNFKITFLTVATLRKINAMEW